MIKTNKLLKIAIPHIIIVLILILTQQSLLTYAFILLTRIALDIILMVIIFRNLVSVLGVIMYASLITIVVEDYLPQLGISTLGFILLGALFMISDYKKAKKEPVLQFVYLFQPIIYMLLGFVAPLVLTLFIGIFIFSSKDVLTLSPLFTAVFFILASISQITYEYKYKLI